MKSLKPAQLPFDTNDAILAYCLHLSGVPYYDDTHPIKVIYSAEILDKFRNGADQPIYKGWALEDAVKDAHKRGLRGHVQYFFQRSPRLSKLLKAYRDQCYEIERPDSQEYLHEVVAKLVAQLSGANPGVTTRIDPDVATMRLACVLLKMRVAFMELWKHQVPLVQIPNEGRVRRYEGVVQGPDGKNMPATVVESPGFKVVSVNASQDTREHLGLQ